MKQPQYLEEHNAIIKHLWDKKKGRVGIMDIYQEFTPTTAVYPKEQWLPYLISGLASEVGEVAGKHKKMIRDNVEWNEFRKQMKDELSDCMWYISELLNHLGMSFNDLVIHNRDKLIDRQNRDQLHGSGDYR